MENYNSICEYLYDNRYPVLVNFLTTLIGAFLGFLFALIVYWITESIKRRKEKHIEKIKAFNTLQRFSMILNSVITISEKQAELFKIYAKDLILKPLSFHFPQIPATNDKERLIKSDTFELFNSFKLFEKSNPNSFKDYKNIFNHSDFLQKYFDDLYLQNEKHINFLHSDLKLIRDNLSQVAIKIGLFQKEIQIKDPKGYLKNFDFQFLEKYKNVYLNLKGTGFTDFEPYRNEFLIPLNDEVYLNISNQKFADEISIQVADTITRIDNIVLNTQSHASNFEHIEDDENVKSAILFLKKILAKIAKINEP